MVDRLLGDDVRCLQAYVVGACVEIPQVEGVVAAGDLDADPMPPQKGVAGGTLELDQRGVGPVPTGRSNDDQARGRWEPALLKRIAITLGLESTATQFPQMLGYARREIRLGLIGERRHVRLIAAFGVGCFRGQVQQGAVGKPEVERVREGGRVSHVYGDLAEEFQWRGPDDGVIIDGEAVDGHAYVCGAFLGDRRVFGQFVGLP